MAVLAEYRDVGPPGYATEAFARGLSQGQSFVERKQEMRLREQRASMMQAEFIAKLPLIKAQTTLTTLNAQAAVKNATTITNLESKAALESDIANKEFLDALQYNVATDENYAGGAVDDTPEGRAQQEAQSKYDTQATLKARSDKLAALSTKYSYMSLLPQYKGFTDTLNKEAANAHVAAGSNLKLEELLRTAEARNDALRYGYDRSVDREKIKAEAKGASAEAYTASRERIAALNANTKLTAQERAGQIAAEKQTAQIASLNDAAADADEKAAIASRAGDEQTAARHRQVASSYRDGVQKLTTYAGQAPLAVPEKSPEVRAKPAAPDSSPPAEVSITIPGSDEAPSNAPLANPPEEEAAPTPAPATAREAAKVPETFHAAPIKVKDWNQAKALKKGTIYIGPDGVVYTRGK